MTTPKYTDEQIIEAVKSSISYREVLIFLGCGLNGSSFMHMKRRIEKLLLNTSHFINVSPKTGIRGNPTNILINEPDRNVRRSGKQLRTALIHCGIEYICNICKALPIHNNKVLVLQVDHIDGNFRNNIKDNLRFLCPNCHTQTENFGSRKNRKPKEIKINVVVPKITENMIIDAISDNTVRTYRALSNRLNISYKTTRLYCKKYSILPPFNEFSISEAEFINAIQTHTTINNVIKYLNITRWQYTKYKKEYNVDFKSYYKRTWITNGTEDKFIVFSEMPHGFNFGKSFNKPPIKQKRE